MIDWMRAPNFSAAEFPAGELSATKPDLIYALQELRAAFGRRIKPSDEPGALARMGGSETSRHYAIGRLSDAIDIFPESDPLRLWQLAVSRFGGVGIYYDTKGPAGYSDVMIHVDMRPSTVWWCRVAGNYYTFNKDVTDTQTFTRMLHGQTVIERPRATS